MLFNHKVSSFACLFCMLFVVWGSTLKKKIVELFMVAACLLIIIVSVCLGFGSSSSIIDDDALQSRQAASD